MTFNFQFLSWVPGLLIHIDIHHPSATEISEHTLCRLNFLKSLFSPFQRFCNSLERAASLSQTSVPAHGSFESYVPSYSVVNPEPVGSGSFGHEDPDPELFDHEDPNPELLDHENPDPVLLFWAMRIRI